MVFSSRQAKRLLTLPQSPLRCGLMISTEAFIAQLPPRLVEGYRARATLASELELLVRTSQEQRPNVDADEVGFLEFVAQRVGDDTELSKLHAGDLRLSFACLLGDPEALAMLERDVIARTTVVVRGNLPAGLTIDEVLQRLRVRLLVRNSEAPPGLSTYSGRGALVHWARAATSRLVQEFARTGQREVATSNAELLEVPALNRDLEVGLVKQRFAAAFAESFKAALIDLSEREQALLRLHYLEGMRAEEIGRVYDTHRTTVWRWLTDCREKLLSGTRRRLAAQIPEQELSSLMNVVHSQLDVSLSRMLKRRE